MPDVYITSAVRTPIASFQGAFAEIPAPRLGAAVIKEAVKRSNLQPENIDEVIMGEVLQAGVGQAPARQAAIYAGLPTSVGAMTINKVCGSGLKAAMLAADSIRLGNADIVVAGGQESMTLAPHLLEKSRAGYRMGNVTIRDAMLVDGLWDPYNDWHMGNAGELCAKEESISREEQDAYAIESYKRAQNAATSGHFKNEIVPVEVQSRKGPVMVESDEDPFKTDFAKIATLKPVFDKAGTITAANASKLNDGAAAVVLMSEAAMKKHGAKGLARVVAHSTHSQDPKWFTTAPVGAIKKVVEKAGLKLSDIDFFEINEAFAVVTMAAMKELSIPHDKVNVHGGAVALGHPIGASGARLLTTLVHALHTHKKRYGLVTLCLGGGEAVAMIIEKL